MNIKEGIPFPARYNIPRNLYLLLSLNNLADRSVASLVESQATTRWGQIKHELCLFIMLLHKNIYIIYEASKTRAKNKRILDTNIMVKRNDSEIQPPLHPRPRVNHHQRLDPQRHERRDVGHVQLLREAPHRMQICLALLVQVLTLSYSRSSNPSPPPCPQSLSL